MKLFSDIKYLQKVMKDVDENFWIYIESIDASEVKKNQIFYKNENFFDF